ncbi:tRNA1(Val) (adenine(37)-N6)-methyltransferase [Pedobacter frigoris]|uniref:tRNA1(Val) (adenine(37)-N6)-methyltransferase n=1 Tax=Pedobacter frigoris TaxID=2571272 RepID=A0A4U1CHW0_9SPHI|nr:methyltransferase [Pedobacter frigoris]TKC06197.1 methyltransferase domain-containing protein [Pedobacter frigoris]
MGSVFKFKQFEVDQDGCAMKINTDGVILGATAVHNSPKRLLDIGTGTGVIAMMLAQRFPDAFIDAVEIDESAAIAATRNFEASAFNTRSVVYHSDINSYVTTSRYDLIVSNPPYFVNDLKNTEQRKTIARHADETFFEALLAKVAMLLNEDGSFWMILPVKQADFIVEKSLEYHLALHRQINICSDERKPVIRKVVCLGKAANEKAQVVAETFYIYEKEGVYTDAYKALLKDFFLAF